MKEYDAYIFDLDGTLLDTLDDLTASVNAGLEAYGEPIRTREEVCSFVGNGFAQLIALSVANGRQNPHYNEILTFFKEHYKTNCIRQTHPYEGILSLLQRLKEKGKRLAVVSNKADFAVKALNDRFFGEWIEVAIGENEAEGIRKKPHPDSVNEAFRILGGGNAVYIGDSDVDVLTAKNAGIDCISVTWGFRERKFLIEAGATCLVDAPSEIF